MILGHNFSKALHIGMLWNVDDVISLARNGMPFAETLPPHDINAFKRNADAHQSRVTIKHSLTSVMG